MQKTRKRDETKRVFNVKMGDDVCCIQTSCGWSGTHNTSFEAHKALLGDLSDYGGPKLKE